MDAQQQVDAVKQEVQVVKSGFRTSEFWFHLAFQILTWATTLNLSNRWAQVIGLALSLLSVLGYTTSRTIVKSGTTRYNKNAS